MEIMINGTLMPVEIIRKRNRNMYLRVDNGQLVVTAHPLVSEREIMRFIHEKENWIIKVMASEQKRKQNDKRQLTGDTIWWLGQPKQVVKQLANRNNVLIDEDKIYFYLTDLSDEHLQKVFDRFAKPYLQRILDAQRLRWDHVVDDYRIKRYPEIKIRRMKSKWGVCTPSEYRIVMNLTLIHYPLDCIDSVLLHEYVHLVVPNHSREFYNVLNSYMPDYKKYKEILG